MAHAMEHVATPRWVALQVGFGAVMVCANCAYFVPWPVCHVHFFLRQAKGSLDPHSCHGDFGIGSGFVFDTSMLKR